MKELLPVYNYLRTFVDLELKDLEPILGHYKQASFKKRDIIFKEGERFTKVTFITKGLVKKYYVTADGQEFIKEFTWEGQVTTPYLSQLQKLPASYTMQAIEDTELLLIEYELVEDLFKKSVKWLQIGKALADFHFLNREVREMELLKFSASERYERFKLSFPGLVNRLKKQDISSYLGITPVSLSRIIKDSKEE